MKFKKAFIPLLLTTVMLAGCGSKDKNKSEIIKNDFNEVRKEAQEIIKTAKYDNLDIKCDSVIFPETDKIATWWIDTIYLNEWKKPDELVNYIIDDITPELIGEIDKQYIYDGEELRKYEKEKDWYNANYENKISKTKYTEAPELIYYRDPKTKRKSEIFTDTNIMNYAAGAINKILGGNYLFGLQDDMELIKRYRIGMDDLSDKYKLLDKEVTVAEAVESAENYINSIYPYTGENGIKTKVYDVYVYKIKNSGETVFKFNRTENYKGIDVQELINGQISFGEEENYGEETGIMSECFMIESGKIDVYYGEYNSYTVPKEITNYETILSLESVLNNVSKELSKLPGVNFEVNQIKMEYRMFNDKEDKSKNDRAKYIVPFWKVDLLNPINNDAYVALVNVESGDVLVRRVQE